MLSTTDAGRLGEAAAFKHFVGDRWYVFLDASGKSPVDMVVMKNNLCKTVQVKTTSYKVNNRWLVQIKTVRPNRTTNKVTHFDPNSVDLLVVYIIPEDRVIVYESATITQRTQLSIPVQDSS
jgi:hypothetical protein